MRLRTQTPNAVLILGAVLLLLASVTVASIWTFKARGKQQPDKLPPVISKVKDVEILSATIKGSDVVLIVRNNSYKSVIAITIESRNETDASGINFNTVSFGNDMPHIIIEPYGTYTLSMSLSNVLPGAPVQIGGVMYSDGTQDGDERTLETMRGQRAHKKANRKGAPPQQ